MPNVMHLVGWRYGPYVLSRWQESCLKARLSIDVSAGRLVQPRPISVSSRREKGVNHSCILCMERAGSYLDDPANCCCSLPVSALPTHSWPYASRASVFGFQRPRISRSHAVPAACVVHSRVGGKRDLSPEIHDMRSASRQLNHDLESL